MNWFVIYVLKERVNDILIWFNQQPDIKAFVVNVERFWSKKGKKEFLMMPMYPNYVFIETCLDINQLRQLIDHSGILLLEKELQNEAQTVMAISGKEKELMQTFMNEQYTIVHSSGVIEDSKLIVQEGPLQGKEDMVKKIDRHKRNAWVGNAMNQMFKIPLEVTSKS